MAHFKPEKPWDRTRAYEIFVDISLIFAIFILPNLVAITMAYVYVYASVNPISAMAAALHHSQGSWIVYQICLPIVTIAAGLANLVILVGGIRLVSRSIILSLLAAVVAFMPIWSPYVIEAALRKHLWNTECDGFDGSFFLDAANYNQQPDLSVAQFPSSFGGQKWTLYQSSPGIYEFAPVGEESQVTYNFINETYSLHTNTTQEGDALTATNVPLSFPQFGSVFRSKLDQIMFRSSSRIDEFDWKCHYQDWAYGVHGLFKDGSLCDEVNGNKSCYRGDWEDLDGPRKWC